jgi:hypothetical protein
MKTILLSSALFTCGFIGAQIKSTEKQIIIEGKDTTTIIKDVLEGNLERQTIIQTEDKSIMTIESLVDGTQKQTIIQGGDTTIIITKKTDDIYINEIGELKVDDKSDTTRIKLGKKNIVIVEKKEEGKNGEKKISVLSVVYDNLGDLNFKCKLCGKLVRDGSRDYHIKQFHGDRMEELKEKKRQIIAERAASDSARRFAQISTPSAPAVQPQEFGSRSSFIVASFLSAGNSVKSDNQKPPSAKSHHKKVSSSEHAEPREPKVLSQLQIEEIKKKGVSLRENEKLRNTIIETMTSFMDEDICCAFRNDEGNDDLIVAKSAFTSPQVYTPGL